MVRRGECSPLELVDEAIARIEAVNPSINAVIHQRFEQATTKPAVRSEPSRSQHAPVPRRADRGEGFDVPDRRRAAARRPAGGQRRRLSRAGEQLAHRPTRRCRLRHRRAHQRARAVYAHDDRARRVRTDAQSVGNRSQRRRLERRLGSRGRRGHGRDRPRHRRRRFCAHARGVLRFGGAQADPRTHLEWARQRGALGGDVDRWLSHPHRARQPRRCSTRCAAARSAIRTRHHSPRRSPPRSTAHCRGFASASVCAAPTMAPTRIPRSPAPFVKSPISSRHTVTTSSTPPPSRSTRSKQSRSKGRWSRRASPPSSTRGRLGWAARSRSTRSSPRNRMSVSNGRSVNGTQYVAAREWLHGWGRRLHAWWNDFDLLLTPTVTQPPVKIGCLPVRPDCGTTWRTCAVSLAGSWACGTCRDSRRSAFPPGRPTTACRSAHSSLAAVGPRGSVATDRGPHRAGTTLAPRRTLRVIARCQRALGRANRPARR